MVGPIAILFYDKSTNNSIEFKNLFYGCANSLTSDVRC